MIKQQSDPHAEVKALRDELQAMKARLSALRFAATDVIMRWESPLWSYSVATANLMSRLKNEVFASIDVDDTGSCQPETMGRVDP
jgi:hypothetical protein